MVKEAKSKAIQAEKEAKANAVEAIKKSELALSIYKNPFQKYFIRSKLLKQFWSIYRKF